MRPGNGEGCEPSRSGSRIRLRRTAGWSRRGSRAGVVAGGWGFAGRRPIPRAGGRGGAWGGAGWAGPPPGRSSGGGGGGPLGGRTGGGGGAARPRRAGEG